MEQSVHRDVRLATGLTTTYLAQGSSTSAPALVLLHAWGESRRAFVRLLDGLPRTLRVVAPDLRGHGDADKPHTGYELAACAADVVALLDLLELPSAVLVGASSGGYLAQQVAVSDPARVAGLCLAGTPRSLRGRAPFADEIDQLADPVSQDWAKAFVLSFATQTPVPSWYVDLLSADASRIPAYVWRASLAGLTSSPPPTTLGTIDAPTLIVSGARDRLLSRAEFEALAALIPGSTRVEYPDAGHLVLWEQPQRLADDIVAFVTGLAAPPRP